MLFVFAVVVTPREAFWAFAALRGPRRRSSRRWPGSPRRSLARRLRFEVPFLAFALFLPLVGQGERVDVLGVSLSVAGLWGAWNIVVKGTLGVAATVLLAATTSMPELLVGLERLRVPRVFVAITGSMIRYGDVIIGEMRRMNDRACSRAATTRVGCGRRKAVAASAGALFVRSYERGERVYLAMLARGYDGALPVLDEHAASRAAVGGRRCRAGRRRRRRDRSAWTAA